MGGLLIFPGCTEDPIDAPTVTITQGETLTLTPSSGPTFNLSLGIAITAPGKIKEIIIYRSNMLGETVVGDVASTLNQNFYQVTSAEFDHVESINFGLFFLGTINKIEFDIVVKDMEDQIGDAKITVTMGAYTALGNEQQGEFWKIHSSGNGSWNLKDNAAVTSIGNDAAVVALRYMINSDNVNTVNDPANFTGSWTSNTVSWTSTGGTPYVTNGNGIQYVKANSYDYTNAPKEVALYMFGAGSPSTDVVNPAVNDIYIGKLGEELYIIKITENNIDEVYTPKANTGVLRFTYKK
jgi:hypothetical protein